MRPARRAQLLVAAFAASLASVWFILVAWPAQTCAMTQIQLTAGPVSDTVQPLGSEASVPCPTAS